MPAVSKAGLAYATLRKQIVSGELSPGSRVTISQVAEQLGISPIPVREACRRLTAEGLLEYNHNAGARVAAPDPTLRYDVGEYLSTLLVSIADNSAGAATDDTLRTLRTLAAKFEEAADNNDFLQEREAITRFILTLIGLSRNTIVREQATEAWEHISVYLTEDRLHKMARIAAHNAPVIIDILERRRTQLPHLIVRADSPETPHTVGA